MPNPQTADPNLSALEVRGKDILGRIANHRNEVEEEAMEWKKDLLAYRNKFWDVTKGAPDDGPEGTTIQAPYLHSFTDVMVSNIVPPNPAVDIRTRRAAKKDLSLIHI